jgi:hypothetical protein
MPTAEAIGKEIPKKNKKTLCRWLPDVSRRQSHHQPDGASADVAPLPMTDVAIGKADGLTRGRRQTSLCRWILCRRGFADGRVTLPSAKPSPMAFCSLPTAASHRQRGRLR